MTRFGDPGFLQHTATSRLSAVAALRLANATLLPYDYARFGHEMGDLAGAIRGQVDTDGEREAVDGLVAAFARLESAGRALALARDQALREGIDKAAASRANAELRQVERAMTREEGLVGRPWFRNLMFAADYDNGYATIAVPSVQEAVRAEDAGRVVDEAHDLTRRVDAAVTHVLAAIMEMR